MAKVDLGRVGAIDHCERFGTAAVLNGYVLSDDDSAMLNGATCERHCSAEVFIRGNGLVTRDGSMFCHCLINETGLALDRYCQPKGGCKSSRTSSSVSR